MVIFLPSTVLFSFDLVLLEYVSYLTPNSPNQVLLISSSVSLHERLSKVAGSRVRVTLFRIFKSIKLAKLPNHSGSSVSWLLETMIHTSCVIWVILGGSFWSWFWWSLRYRIFLILLKISGRFVSWFAQRSNSSRFVRPPNEEGSVLNLFEKRSKNFNLFRLPKLSGR